MDLGYRMVQHDDLPALQKLWTEHTNWGALTAQMWQRYVVDAPLGGVAGSLAYYIDTGEIVGQFAFMPSLVTVNGREYRAFRMAAPIVAKTLRFSSPNPLAHPVVKMYFHATKALAARGDGLIYTVPDARWVRFFKMFPRLQAGKFPLWKIDLPIAEIPMPQGFVAAPAKELSGDRVDRLWKQWSQFHPCSVIRDSRLLPSKIGGGEYDILGVERDGELVGLVASRRKGDRQWLICDLIAADADASLRATLIAVVNLANRRTLEAEPDKPIRKAAILSTPIVDPHLRALGFVRDAYDFPLIIHILNPDINKDDLTPERWYVTAND